MSDKFKLYNNIENFITNNCKYNKNESFNIKFSAQNDNSNSLPRVNDGSNFIQCIMNIPKEKESIIKEAQNSNEINVKINDSSFEFVLYKNNNNLSVIKCLILLIINDFEKVEGNIEEEKKEKISDINNEYKLLENLKKFIFNYIKKNKKNKNNNSNNTYILENILLAGAQNGIRFFNHEQNGINYEDENIKKIIEVIKTISSKLEIKQKKNESEKNDKTNEGSGESKQLNKSAKKETENDINEVLDELNPDYKNELIYRYLDEMPEEIVALMKKYRNINFTKSMYMEYLDKNKNEGENGDMKIEENI